MAVGLSDSSGGFIWKIHGEAIPPVSRVFGELSPASTIRYGSLGQKIQNPTRIFSAEVKASDFTRPHRTAGGWG